jgi:hypothetical protein
LGDRVAIGMLLFKNNQLTYRFSEDKLSDLKSILGSKKDLINKSLLATQKYVENIDTNKKPIFNEARNIVSESYLEKLSIYSNGIIQYEKPRLAVLTDTFDLNTLFDSFFPPKTSVKEENYKDKFKQIIESNFISKVSQSIHVKIDIDYTIIPDFYLSYNLDAIGKNGILYLAKYLDFTKVQNAAISHLLVTNDSLSKHFNNGQINKIFIFGEEPKLNTDEHKKWDYLHKLDGFSLKHPTESCAVADHILDAGAKKFLEV